MKNPGNNQRSQNRGNTQRRNNKNTPRNGQGRNNNSGNNQNRKPGNGQKSHTPHLWASSSSSTALTSHLSMMDKRNQHGSNKNTNSKDGSSRSNGKSGGRLNQDQNGKNRNNTQGRFKNRHRSNQSSSTHQNRSSVNTKNNSVKSEQQSRTKYSAALESKTNTFGIDPFELFCAYHLGISPTNQYRPSNINEVSNRFKLETGVTRQILKEYGMDSAALLDRDFDMAMAQLDIQVAPDGVNRTELARNIFEDFLEAPIKKRDWKKIIEEDKKMNAKTFNTR